MLLQDIYVLLEIRLVELLQAVLFAQDLLCRLQDGEAVLRNESIFFPRFALLIMVGSAVPSRHEDDQNGYRDEGEKHAIEVSLEAQFVFMIVSAHFFNS